MYNALDSNERSITSTQRASSGRSISRKLAAISDSASPKKIPLRGILAVLQYKGGE